MFVSHKTLILWISLFTDHHMIGVGFIHADDPPIPREESTVDDRSFDALSKAVTGTWPSRRAVLSRLGLGALAAIGISRGTTVEEADAKKRKSRKRKICLCTGDTAGSCKTKKVKRRKLKKTFKKNPCSYGGKCNGSNPCAPPPTAGFTIAPDVVSVTNISVACPQGTECTGGVTTCVSGLCLSVCVGTGQSTCPTGFSCLGLVCLPDDVANAVTCVTGADCDTGRCDDNLLCALCPAAAVCGEAGSEQCCVAEAECINDLCVIEVG